MRVKGFSSGVVWLAALCSLATIPIAFGQTDSVEAIRLNNIGVAYMNQARFDAALESFRRAHQLDSSLDVARMNEGIALIQAQLLDEARDVLVDALDRLPSSARAWFNLGLTYRTLGDADAAIESFERALALDPGDADTVFFLGQLHAQAGRYDQAIERYTQCLSLDPRHVSAEFGLARAYLLSGNEAAATEHLARFDDLTASGLTRPISSAYGEQGPYSTAEPVAGVDPVPSELAVRFVVDADAGLDSGQAAPVASTGLASVLGPGACYIDIDNDGQPDLLLPGSSGRTSLYRNTAGRFTNITSSSGISADGDALGCAVGDYDNDTYDDIALGLVDDVRIYRNAGDGTFTDVTADLGVEVSGFPLGLSFVDYDHDGDVDLYVAQFADFDLGPDGRFDFPFTVDAPANQLWRNNGDGTFVLSTADAGVAGDAPTVGALASDLDNDRAIDLVLTGWRTNALVLSNPRDGAFVASEPWSEPFPAPPAGVAAVDFDKDGWMDLAFTHWGAPGMSLWRNTDGGDHFERVALPDVPWDRGWGLAAVDFDNDGWVDFAAVGESASNDGDVRLFRNMGDGQFADVTSAIGLDARLVRPRALITADVDDDGDADLLITQNGGAPLVLRNDGGNSRASVRLSFSGLADNRSGIGTKVEVFAGPLRQKWELTSSSGYLGQNAPGLLAGIDHYPQADIVRLLWPTGVVQDEVELPAGQLHRLTEIDRRGSSCPVVWVWNGERYEFIADMIGPGIVGHWVAPGQRNIPDPTEYLKIDGDRVAVRDGRISIRFAEVMEELTYLDHVRLLAVDRPREIEVYPNEYFASQPPFPEFKVITTRSARPPAAARDDGGRDVLALLTDRDRRYVEGLGPAPFGGFAPMHYLELDLGELDTTGPLRLLMHGFIEYFTATSVFAAHQAGVHPIVPFVDAQQADGSWVRAIDDIGFPAGTARTSIADLSGRLPAGTSRIRIGTNLRIYWDQILIDTSPQTDHVELHEIPLVESALRFLGFPRQMLGTPAADLTYDYDQVSASGPFWRHAGSYTAYGDVQTLVTSSDDRFAILGAGDEVALEFDASGLPPVRPGWARDYFFYADGFTKDMDFYEALSATVEPLPFHDMGEYPYGPGTRYPTGPAHLDYRLNVNTRHVSGREGHSFRFEYSGAGPVTEPEENRQ